MVKNVRQVNCPITIKQFGLGQSNPTYLVIGIDDTRAVCRKNPPGELLSKMTHNVEREHRVLHALRKTEIPVPIPYCLCEDNSVLGMPFYFMSFLDGRLHEDAELPLVSPEERQEMWHDAVRTLGKIHLINIWSTGLKTFGKSSNFYNRQIATFTRMSDTQCKVIDVETKQPVGKISHFDEMVSFFKDKKLQPHDRETLIYGDFKMDNVFFHNSKARVIGVLENNQGQPTFQDGITLGMPTYSTILKWYNEEVGWDVEHESGWASAFAIFSPAVITQGIAARRALRQTSSIKRNELAYRMVQNLIHRGKSKSKI
ncbi:putative acyl-CoA dehydrogenase family member 10 [Mytilinidion resinicola]|uniref:Acyl-CoA dehydrogenase family member 10 n=1 Tax=Mytilinidion resinicola TaxID=574789 RepID=A0A6A6YDA8_9PEZI|nr:putative acyl-CoA dehydrogenase family member 10 [Mytilinidion resinicola]KAF2806811.1 putative acyl-CoA dehydrogenase family member 10 [Mytilinidion resinicola]